MDYRACCQAGVESLSHQLGMSFLVVFNFFEHLRLVLYKNGNAKIAQGLMKIKRDDVCSTHPSYLGHIKKLLLFDSFTFWGGKFAELADDPTGFADAHIFLTDTPVNSLLQHKGIISSFGEVEACLLQKSDYCEYLTKKERETAGLRQFIYCQPLASLHILLTK